MLIHPLCTFFLSFLRPATSSTFPSLLTLLRPLPALVMPSDLIPICTSFHCALSLSPTLSPDLHHTQCSTLRLMPCPYLAVCLGPFLQVAFPCPLFALSFLPITLLCPPLFRTLRRYCFPHALSCHLFCFLDSFRRLYRCTL